MRELDNEIFYIISSTVLLILSLVVSFRRKNINRLAGIFLMGYFWSSFLSAAITFIVLSPLIESVPHFFRCANIFFLLLMPFSFLYFRQTLYPGEMTWKDLFHLIPVLLYIIDYTPFFLLPGNEKLIILHSLNNYGIKAGFGEGFFMPSGSHNLIRYVVMLGYWFAQGRLLLKIMRLASVETGSDFMVQRKWLICLQLSEPLFFMPGLTAAVFGRIDLMVMLSNFFALIAALIQGYFLLMNPQVLYGLPFLPQGQANPGPDLEVTGNQAGEEMLHKDKAGEIPAYTMNLNESTLDSIGDAIEKVMQEKRLYLNPKLKISDLAIASGFLSYKLSAFFSIRSKHTFNDFLNKKRVDYCAQKMDAGEYQIKTLEAISKESGFHSRSTFIRAFKKFKGKTPSEYIKAEDEDSGIV